LAGSSAEWSVKGLRPAVRRGHVLGRPVGGLADRRHARQRARGRLAERALERAVERRGDELGRGLLLLEDARGDRGRPGIAGTLRQPPQHPVGGDLQVLEGKLQGEQHVLAQELRRSCVVPTRRMTRTLAERVAACVPSVASRTTPGRPVGGPDQATQSGVAPAI
jgi:hypothetical protein